MPLSELAAPPPRPPHDDLRVAMPAKKTIKPAAKNTTPTPAKAPAKKAPANKPVAKQPVAKKAPQSMPYELGKWAHVYTRAVGERRYWLVKSEPDVFSFDDLMAAPKRTTSWDSVRNTGARNFLRDAMKLGDGVLYYHSNAEPSAIVGLGEVVREGYPDHTAFDPTHAYYDADSHPDTPTWFMVDVRGVKKLKRPISLPEVKAHPILSQMALIKVSRLSVVPVTQDEWDLVISLSDDRRT
jgi:predicted RNA-binding protein with PUA-like domain